MSRELNGFEAFCAGFHFSGEGFNGEMVTDEGLAVADIPQIQEKWRQITKESEMDQKVRAELVRQLAVYISEVKDARLLNSAWAKLYTSSGELLGQISPRHLIVALLEEMHLIDLHTENGSEPVDISETDRLEFYIG